MTEFERQARERAEILARLESLADDPDTEQAHKTADALVIRYLTIIGAEDLAGAFERVATADNG